MFELYDVDAVSSEISNLSTRGRAENGDQGAMIGGFIIGGTEATEVMVRAIGPSLTNYGIVGALSDPVEIVTAKVRSSVLMTTGARINSNKLSTRAFRRRTTENQLLSQRLFRAIIPHWFTAPVRLRE